MNQISGFHTLKGYQLGERGDITFAMEDYLEMICRITVGQEKVRINDLARRLNVRPSSTTKMVQQLSLLGYLQAEKYGNITLTEKGREMGGYLLYRHGVVNRFLCYINSSADELEEAEKIEHFLSRRTIDNLDRHIKNFL